MLGLLIFNHLNDVLYVHGDMQFLSHIRTLSVSQGLPFHVYLKNNGQDVEYFTQTVGEDLSNIKENKPLNESLLDSISKKTQLDPNIIIQLFSPLVTSQYLMSEQFGNSYSAITCEDGISIVFQEFRGYLFLAVGTRTELFLKRFVNISVHLVQMTVGLCVKMLKSNLAKCQLLDNLIASWLQLYSKEQSYLVEAIERFVVNPDVLLNVMTTLATIMEKLKKSANVTPVHAIFFKENKLLALYSSENANDLSGGDLLMLNLLAQSLEIKPEPFICLIKSNDSNVVSPSCNAAVEECESDEEDFYEKNQCKYSPKLHEDDLKFDYDLKIFNLLMPSTCELVPHTVVMYPVGVNLSLLIIVQIPNVMQIGTELNKLINLFESIRNEDFKQSELMVLEYPESLLSKSQDLIKNLPKSSSIAARRNLMQTANHWESAKLANIEDWMKSNNCELPSRIESCISAALETAKSTWQTICLDFELSTKNYYCEGISQIIKEKMGDAHHNMYIGARSIISVNKYLEEFPGLVHFLYIDRSVHQLTAPTIWLDKYPDEVTTSIKPIEESSIIKHLTCTKIWSMVNFAREHLSKGHTSLIWKDKTFSYSYFLWFEDTRGNPLKSLQLSDVELETLPIPGVICGDFYSQLTSKVLPSIDLKKVKSFELFCIHLGLTTSPCILEQTRRIAATVWEIAGPSTTNPVDLL